MLSTCFIILGTILATLAGGVLFLYWLAGGPEVSPRPTGTHQDVWQGSNGRPSTRHPYDS